MRGREPSFAPAVAILGKTASDGVTIAALCERMHVATGAFCYHFTGLGEFLTVSPPPPLERVGELAASTGRG